MQLCSHSRASYVLRARAVSGASTDPCSDVYGGPSAGSEKIIQDGMKFIMANKQIQAYMTLHSYSEMWFYPYAYAPDTYPPNIAVLVGSARVCVRC